MHFSLGVIVPKEFDLTKENWEKAVDDLMEPFHEQERFIGEDEYSLDEAIEMIENQITLLKSKKKYLAIDDLFIDSNENGLRNVLANVLEIDDPDNIEIDFDEETVSILEYDWSGEFDWYDYSHTARWTHIPLKDGCKHIFNRPNIAKIKDIAFEKELTDKEIEKAKKEYYGENEAFAAMFLGKDFDDYLENIKTYSTYAILGNGHFYSDEWDDLSEYIDLLKENFDEDDIFVLVDCHI